MKSRLGRLGLVLALIGAVGLVAWLGQSIGARVGSALDQMAGAVAPGPAAAPVVASSSGQATDDEEFVMSKEVCGYDFPFDEDSPRARAAEREIETQAMLGLRRAAERLSAETDPRQRTLGLVLSLHLFELDEVHRGRDAARRAPPCGDGDAACEAERSRVYRAQQRGAQLASAPARTAVAEQLREHARSSGDPLAWAAVGCSSDCAAWLQAWSRAQPDAAVPWLRQVRTGNAAETNDGLLRAAARASDYREYDSMSVAAQLSLAAEVKTLPPAAWATAYVDLASALAVGALGIPQWQDVMQACKAAAPGSPRSADCLTIGTSLSERSTNLISSRIGDAIVRHLDPEKDGRRRELAGRQLLSDYGAASQETVQLGASCAGIAHLRERVEITAAGGEVALARALAPRGQAVRAHQARDAARDAQSNPFAPGAAPEAPRN